MTFDREKAIADAVRTDDERRRTAKEREEASLAAQWEGRSADLRALLVKKIGQEVLDDLGGEIVPDVIDTALVFQDQGHTLTISRSTRVGFLALREDTASQWWEFGSLEEFLKVLGEVRELRANQAELDRRVAELEASSAEITSVIAQYRLRLGDQAFRWPTGKIAPLIRLWWADSRGQQEGWASLTYDIAFRRMTDCMFVVLQETLEDATVMPYVYKPQRAVYYLWDHTVIGELLRATQTSDLPTELIEPITLVIAGIRQVVRDGSPLFRVSDGGSASVVVGYQPLKWVRDYLGVPGTETVIHTTWEREKANDTAGD
jgi:hypothetical protein